MKIVNSQMQVIYLGVPNLNGTSNVQVHIWFDCTEKQMLKLKARGIYISRYKKGCKYVRVPHKK